MPAPPPPCQSICLRRRSAATAPDSNLPRAAMASGPNQPQGHHLPTLRPISRRHSLRPRSASRRHGLRGEVPHRLRGRPATCRPRRRPAIRCRGAAPTVPLPPRATPPLSPVSYPVSKYGYRRTKSDGNMRRK